MHREFKGVWIPAKVWLNKDLSIQEKALLIEAASFDECFAGNEHFAEFLGVSVPRVKAIIGKLKNAGYLKTKQVRKGQVTVRRFIYVNEAKLIGWDQKQYEDGIESDTKFGSETILSSDRKQYEVGIESNPHTNTGLLNTSTSTGTNTIIKDIVQNAVDEAFEHFWSSMALSKKNKAKAKQVFTRQVKALKVEPMFFADQLIEDTKRRKNDFGFDKLHPTTYLNNHRWEDELDKPSQPKQQGNHFDYSVDQSSRLFGGQ